MKRQGSGNPDGAAPAKRTALNPESILRHQNRELASAVQRAKSELALVKDNLSRLEAERDLFDATSSVIDRAWKLLDSDLLSLAQSIGIKDLSHPPPPRVEAETNGILPTSSKLISSLAEAADCFVLGDVTKNIEEDGDEDAAELQAAGSSHLDLEATLRERIIWTTSLLGRLIEVISKGNVSENVSALHSQIHALEAKILFLSSRLKLSKKRIRDLAEELDNAKTEIWRLSRRLDGFELGESVILGSAMRAKSDDQQMDLTSDANEPLDQATSTAKDEDAVAQIQTQNGKEHDSADMKASLEEVKEIAATRLEEIERLRLQLKDAIMTSPLTLEGDSKDTRSEGHLGRELQKERQLRMELSKKADRANSISLMALRRLREAEEKVAEFEAASQAIAQTAESATAKENAKLKQSLDEMRILLDQKIAQLESTRSLAVSLEETVNTLRAVTEERDALKRKLDEHKEKSASGGDDADALIGEIEELSAALGTARESITRLQQTLTDRDKRVSEVLTEKSALEADLRELKEEKNALALRHEKAQVVLKENESYVLRLEERLNNERAVTQRAEDMAKASLEACDKATAEREQFKREAEAEREKAAAATLLEEELRQTRVRVEEAKWELSKSDEEVKTLKRRLERAKAALESAAKASSSSSSTGKSGLRSIDEERLEAMTAALRCPVYKHLWRDCVITKCAHMFSRKALEDNLARRNRKCPTCKNAYMPNDILNVYLYQSNDS